MHLSSALVAAFAATASAFLVPPHISEEFKDARFRGGPPEHIKDFVHNVLEQRTTTFDLACPDCPFAISDVEAEAEGQSTSFIWWKQDIENVIHLEFDTHDHTFNVNGHPLLPLEAAIDAQSIPLKAHQIRIDTEANGLDVPLNFAMDVTPKHTLPDGASILDVEFTVLSLSGTPVKTDTVHLTLVQPPNNGNLVIVKSSQVPFEETPGAQECETSGSWSLCRLKAIITYRFKAMIEAARSKTAEVHGWVKEKTKGCHKGHGGWRQHGPHADGDHPHSWGHHGHHGHHRHPHQYHRLGHMLHQTVRFFIIPALLGVIGGLAASAIGMLVGQLIVFVWLRVYRRGQRGPFRPAEHEIIIIEEEKDELLGEQELLPAYEDAPRYEDAVSSDEGEKN